MLFGFVAVMGANLMESLYIGRVGTLELAALGFTFPLVMTLLFVLILGTTSIENLPVNHIIVSLK